MDRSPLGSSAHEILQTRTLEWIAIPFSRGSMSWEANSWIKPKYLALQADSLPSEPPGKPLKDHRCVFLFIEQWEAVKGF